MDKKQWVATKPNFLLPVFVLSRLFRRLILEKLATAHADSKLVFFSANAHLTCPRAFAAFLAPLRKKRWFVYAKEPFAGPEQVLAYLSRYTHRVAISNGRLLKIDGNKITFRVKNYRVDGNARYTTMTLDIGEFIRRFLLHVLPKGFHRIRHYGLLATGQRAANVRHAREMLGVDLPIVATAETANDDAADCDGTGANLPPCPCCGSRQRIVETFMRGETPSYRPTPRSSVFRIDTS